MLTDIPRHRHLARSGEKAAKTGKVFAKIQTFGEGTGGRGHFIHRSGIPWEGISELYPYPPSPKEGLAFLRKKFWKKALHFPADFSYT
jgi:hypothetical protein